MTRDQLVAVMATHNLFDGWMLFHGYRTYLRDYELIVALPSTFGAERAGIYSYAFRHCPVAETHSSIRPEIWRISLDDRLASAAEFRRLSENGETLEGYVWATGISAGNMLYPGWTLVEPSQRAEDWSQQVGIDFHEVRIEANAHNITLVFADLIVTRLADDIDEPDDGLPRWAQQYWSLPSQHNE